jgi:hypothetical protein
VRARARPDVGGARGRRARTDESRAREIFEKLAHSPRTTAPRERNDPVVARKGVSFEIARFLTLSTDRTSSIDEARETIKTV